MKKLQYLFAGIIGALVGSSTSYFLITWEFSPNPIFYDKTKLPNNNIGPPLIYNFPELPFLIKEYPFRKSTSNGRLDYFIGNNTDMQLLVDKFQKEINYGPEILGIKSLDINNANLISNDKSGLYISTSNQIIINTVHFFNFLKAHTFFNTNIKPELSKIQWLFEILAHEYGHHLSYIYLSSPHPTKEKINKKILEYQEDEQITRNPNYINANFVEAFEKIFQYRDPNTLVDKYEKKENWGTQFTNLNLKKMKSEIDDKKIVYLPKTYSLKEIYESSNYKKNVEIDSNYLYTFSYPLILNEKIKDSSITKKYSAQGSPVSKTNPIYKKNQVEYYLSIEELITRKYGLSTISWTNEVDQITKWANQNYGMNLPTVLTPLEQDSQKYSTKYTSKDTKNYYIDYYQDNPFQYLKNSSKAIDSSKKKVDAFVDLILDYMGVNTTSNISFMMASNQFQYLYSSKIDNKVYNKNIKYYLKDSNQLTLGGFLTDAQKAELDSRGPYYICFENSINDQVIKYPINIQQKIYKKKNALQSQAKEYKKRFMWFLKPNNYLDADKVKDKNIFIMSSNNKKVYLKSFRGEDLSKSGFTSTWVQYYPNPRQISEKEKAHIFEIAKKEDISNPLNNYLQIKKGPKYLTTYKKYESPI